MTNISQIMWRNHNHPVIYNNIGQFRIRICQKRHLSPFIFTSLFLIEINKYIRQGRLVGFHYRVPKNTNPTPSCRKPLHARTESHGRIDNFISDNLYPWYPLHGIMVSMNRRNVDVDKHKKTI